MYLFVFGKLVDAYQNCWINHISCIKMVLYAHYFMDLWVHFFDRAGYSKTKYFLSLKAANIIRIVIKGLLSLIIMYCDHLGNSLYPLLFGLHSSELCKHIFAVSQTHQGFHLT